MIILQILGLLLIGWLLAAGLMVFMFQLQRKVGDAGIVDISWSLGVAGVAACYAMLAADEMVRVIVVMGLVIAWALRLSLHVWYRFRHLPPDGRYEKLAEHWGSQARARMFRFYQMQALGIVIFSMPILVALLNPEPLSWIGYCGLVVGLIGVIGESIADWQLNRFRRNPANRGEVCQSGLWRFSRHPNYFFEWLHWWGYVGLAITWMPWGLLSLIGPLAMWYFLTQVTGIPQTEAQAIRSRGDKYREYQRSTNAFFPWFPHPPKNEQSL